MHFPRTFPRAQVFENRAYLRALCTQQQARSGFYKVRLRLSIPTGFAPIDAFPKNLPSNPGIQRPVIPQGPVHATPSPFGIP